MKGAVSSVESRTAGDIVLFDVDEARFDPEGTRVITKNNALDGTVLTTDWGYPEGNIKIRVANLLLSRANYEILIGMKEDNTNNFMFHYKNSTWKIAMESVRGVPEGDKIKTSLRLSVIEKFPDGEKS